MSDLDALDERLRAVERALTDGDDDLTDLRNAAELTRELELLSARLDDAEARVDELDAATQALRGYVGNVRAVNESVERRADAALAKAESLEAEARTDDGATSDSGATDGRVTDSDPPVTCGCRSRRSELDRGGDDGDDGAESSDDQSGLLARIAEAL